MTKVSTNAGKHPYLRTDLGDLFEHMHKNNNTISLKNINPKFHVEIDTEYSDKNKKQLFYGDIVVLENNRYKVDYDTRELSWVFVNQKNPKLLKKLNKFSKLAELKVMYNK
jgi:hypothetical protein